MDPLSDLDLDVQRLIGGHVELVEHFVNIRVTGGLTLGTRGSAHVSAGLVRVLTADLGVLGAAAFLTLLLDAAAAFLAVLLGAAAFLARLLGAAACDGVELSAATSLRSLATSACAS